MLIMDYCDYFDRLQTTDPDLALELAGIASLEKLLPWFQRAGAPLDRLEVVTQDEYAHDLVVPLRGGTRWLVFGMT